MFVCLQAFANVVMTNPFEHDVWGREKGPLQRWEIERAIEREQFETKPYSACGYRDWPTYDHVGRIALLVVAPDPLPLTVEVISVDGSFLLLDGHHRLAAAIYRDDSHVPINIGGYVDLFPLEILQEISHA